MVSALRALDSGSSAPEFEPWSGSMCSWAIHFSFAAPLSTQVYKWVPVNFMLVAESTDTPCQLILQKLG